MTLYKLVRYFVFLFLIVFTILYLLRSSVTPVPQLLPAFVSIDSFYNKTSQNTNDINREERVIQEFQQNSDSLFQEQKLLIQRFLQDISLPLALEAAINREFNDLNYLIDNYLAHDLFFKDLTIYQNNRLIYKYNNYYNLSAVILSNRVLVSDNSVNIEFIFDQSILQEKLDNIEELIFVKRDNKIQYSSKYDNVDPEVLAGILAAPDLFEGKTLLPKGKLLYGYIVTNALKVPLNTFVVYQQSFGWNSIKQFFMNLLFPLFWFLLIVLDKIFYHYLVKREQNAKQKNQFNSVKESDVEESWDWVDRFIKIEDLTDKEVVYKEQEKQGVPEYQQSSDIKGKDF